MDREIWKDIQGYGGKYQVSNLGRVRSILRNKILIPKKTKKGYLRIRLYENNHCKNIVIHRLVAFAFIPNPENKPQVNHKDGNKENNCVSNLEWCSCYENFWHANKHNLTRFKWRPVALMKNGIVIQRFESQTKAFKETKSKYGNPQYRATKGSHCGEYYWVFIDD